MLDSPILMAMSLQSMLLVNGSSKLFSFLFEMEKNRNDNAK